MCNMSPARARVTNTDDVAGTDDADVDTDGDGSSRRHNNSCEYTYWCFRKQTVVGV